MSKQLEELELLKQKVKDLETAMKQGDKPEFKKGDVCWSWDNSDEEFKTLGIYDALDGTAYPHNTSDGDAYRCCEKAYIGWHFADPKWPIDGPTFLRGKEVRVLLVDRTKPSFNTRLGENWDWGDLGRFTTILMFKIEEEN